MDNCGEMSVSVTLGDVLRRFRKRRRMNVTDLADKSGVDKNTISAYERGRTPKPDKLDAIARALHTTATEIFNSMPQRNDPLMAALARAYTVADAKTQRAVCMLLGLDDRSYVGRTTAPHDEPPRPHPPAHQQHHKR